MKIFGSTPFQPKESALSYINSTLQKGTSVLLLKRAGSRSPGPPGCASAVILNAETTNSS